MSHTLGWTHGAGIGYRRREARPDQREPARRDAWISPGAHAVRYPDSAMALEEPGGRPSRRPPWCPMSRSLRSSQQLMVSADGSDSATPGGSPASAADERLLRLAWAVRAGRLVLADRAAQALTSTSGAAQP